MEAGLGQKALTEGKTLHKYYREGTLKFEVDFDLFVKTIEQNGFRLVYCSRQNGSEDRIFVAADRAVNLTYRPSNRSLSISVFALQEDVVQALETFTKEAVVKLVTRGRVYVVVSGQEGPSLRELGVAGEDFEPTNYRPETVEAYRHIVADLNESDPCGSVVILDGPPGTGKTHMVRAVLNEVPRAKFILVPSNMLSQLGSPSFVNVLMNEQQKGRPLVLVIEDADECLASRKADSVSEISALLNFSDGLMGKIIDMRIVATTNVEVEDLDPAVMRDGRLCRRLEVGKLDAAQANSVYQRLTEKTDSPFAAGHFYTLAEAYRAARGSDGVAIVRKTPKVKLGFQPADPEEETVEAIPGGAAQLLKQGFSPGDVISTDRGDLVRVMDNGQFEVVQLNSEDTIDEDPEETPVDD